MLEQPGTQFRIYRSTAVDDNQGGGIGAMTLPGTRIRGVIVDNPSGSWVKLDGIGLGFQPYIAPYTLAWSVSLLPSVNELSAAYVDGPTGQVSTSAGAPLVVYVFESQVPSSPGSNFQTAPPATLNTSPYRSTNVVANTFDVATIHLAVVGVRFRIMAFSISIFTPGGFVYGYIDDGVSPSMIPFAVLSGTSYSPVLPEGGMLLETVGAPIVLHYAGSVASLTWRGTVWYRAEAGY